MVRQSSRHQVAGRGGPKQQRLRDGCDRGGTGGDGTPIARGDPSPGIRSPKASRSLKCSGTGSRCLSSPIPSAPRAPVTRLASRPRVRPPALAMADDSPGEVVGHRVGRIFATLFGIVGRHPVHEGIRTLALERKRKRTRQKQVLSLQANDNDLSRKQGAVLLLGDEYPLDAASPREVEGSGCPRVVESGASRPLDQSPLPLFSLCPGLACTAQPGVACDRLAAAAQRTCLQGREHGGCCRQRRRVCLRRRLGRASAAFGSPGPLSFSTRTLLVLGRNQTDSAQRVLQRIRQCPSTCHFSLA